MMAETDVDPDALEGIASRLRIASTDLESTASPPAVPEAGEASGLLASILTHMTMSLDGAITGIGAAGDAVASGSGLFRDTEGTNRATMNAQLPE